MAAYKRIIFPVLRRFDAESVHDQTVKLLERAQATTIGRHYLRKLAGEIPDRPVKVFGLSFPNELGIAAGFDKDVRITGGLALLGFGHIEVGTLTPRPQAGNPRPRIFRLPEDEAIINRMGFPNCGAREAVQRLQSLHESPHTYVVGVSMGKQKETPLGDAVSDYIEVMRAVYPFADYLAVNISSPNTPGLRDLQGREYIRTLLSMLMEENHKLAGVHRLTPRPLLLKVAPDLTWHELDALLESAVEQEISGIIATNTTLARDKLSAAYKDEEGGLSGRPLSGRCDEIIRYIANQTAGALPIIGTGGVFTAEDVRTKMDAGASLVQVYTGLIYEGPGMVGRLLREL